jgi:hypothetical protein
MPTARRVATVLDVARSSQIHRGRFTADIEGDFVVFLIGMRFNKPWKVHRWLPVATAMPKMLRVLDQHPELGCLGYEQWPGRTTLLLQFAAKAQTAAARIGATEDDSPVIAPY